MAAAAKIPAPAPALALAEEDFTAGELEVAAILCDLSSIVLRGCSLSRPEIPTWGRRRPRLSLVRKPPAAKRLASPDTPLKFPGESGEEAAAAQKGKKKARTHDEWVQEQRSVVASLSLENAHLSKEIEEYRARLLSSRGANESLKQMQSKIERRRREEEVQAAVHRPALGLDLNAPALGVDLNAPAPKPTPVPEWYCIAQRRAAAAEARRWRREIRRAKVASSPFARRTRAR